MLMFLQDMGVVYVCTHVIMFLHCVDMVYLYPCALYYYLYMFVFVQGDEWSPVLIASYCNKIDVLELYTHPTWCSARCQK